MDTRQKPMKKLVIPVVIGHAVDSSLLTLPWLFTISINNAVFISDLPFLICVLLHFFQGREKNKAQDLED